MNDEPIPDLPELPKLPDLPRPVESAPTPKALIPSTENLLEESSVAHDQSQQQAPPTWEKTDQDQLEAAFDEDHQEEIEVFPYEEEGVSRDWDRALDRPIRTERRSKSNRSSGSRVGRFLLTTIITGALVAGFRFYFSSDQNPSPGPGDEEFVAPNVKFNHRFDYGFETESTDPMEDQRRYIEQFNQRQIDAFNRNSPAQHRIPSTGLPQDRQFPGVPQPRHQPPVTPGSPHHDPLRNR